MVRMGDGQWVDVMRWGDGVMVNGRWSMGWCDVMGIIISGHVSVGHWVHRINGIDTSFPTTRGSGESPMPMVNGDGQWAMGNGRWAMR